MNKEYAALLREEEEIEAKRKKLKEAARLHRDSGDEASLSSAVDGLRALEKRSAEIKSLKDVIISQLSNETHKKNEEAINNFMNTTRNFEDGMKRHEAIETPEYRAAFLKTWQGRKSDLTDVEQRAMTTVNNAAAIPTITLDLIMGKLLSEETIAAASTIYNIPNLLKIPIEDLVNDAAWVAQGADGTAKDDTTRDIVLSPYKLIRLIRVTREASEMSINAFETWIADRMVKKMKMAIDNAIANGTGTGQPTGFTNGITWTEDANQITASTNLTYDNLVDLETLIGEDYINDAVYIMNRKALAKIRKIKDENKKPLFERAIEDGFAGYIGGIPVKLSRFVDDIYLGDFKAAAVGNFISPIEFASSQEIGFLSGDTVFRALALFDSKPTKISGALARIKITA